MERPKFTNDQLKAMLNLADNPEIVGELISGNVPIPETIVSDKAQELIDNGDMFACLVTDPNSQGALGHIEDAYANHLYTSGLQYYQIPQEELESLGLLKTAGTTLFFADGEIQKEVSPAKPGLYEPSDLSAAISEILDNAR